MKEALSSLDIAACVTELQSIVGGHVDKAYHPEHDHLVLAVRPPSGGKSYLHFVVGRWLHLSSKSTEMPQQPSSFAMMLRKRVTNAKIIAARQEGFDRIVVLTLQKDGEYDLVLELFGDGNVVLVKDGVIEQPLSSHTWKHRDVRARKPFSFPPPVPDPSKMTPDGLVELLRTSDTDLVRTLATKLNLGGRYSEEVCARTGTDKSEKASEISPDTAQALLEAILRLRDEASAAGPGYVVSKGSEARDVVPLRMRTYEDLSMDEFPSFFEAIERYLSRIPAARTEERPQRADMDLGRLKRKLAQQEGAVQRLQDEARETQLLGDFIFARYSEVSTALSQAKDALIGHGDMKDIRGHVSYDKRTAALTVKIDGNELVLEVKESLESNAKRYYEGAKRTRKKLEGALAALEETRNAIQEHESGRKAAESTGRRRHKPTKKFWFERFRWFISSEGAIVLGGKDAKSNDILVKRHLDAGDRYAHADIHGAPSVVVKMRAGVTQETLEEACEFTVANSKAWNANIGAAAGYWVLPEQVSKTPQSGEFLAKGAFVIRGKRNYTGKTEIKLGVGEIEFEGQRKVMAGPERAVKARSKKYVILRPGTTDKNEFAKRLADVFEVPIEEILSVLPPGGVDVVEAHGLAL